MQQPKSFGLLYLEDASYYPKYHYVIYGKGGYKNIINQLSSAGYDVITLPEYNKKIVKYAIKKGIMIEDELKYLPIYFENKFRKRWRCC